jgi:tetratricopeptide (TPR) repeat protein
MFGSIMARLRPVLACVTGAVALVGLATTPARAEWLKAESPHFVVYGDVGEGDLRNYVRKVERFDALLRLWFPVQTDIEAPKLSIYLADGSKDMRKIWPDIPSNVGGFYTPGEERIFAVTGGRGAENDQTLFHEYCHHFMQQYLTAAYPGWFVEGFAEYFATAELTPGHMRVGLPSPGRMNSLTMGANTWLPMETVLRSRSLEIGSRGHFYYAQSWALTNYFMSTPERRAALGRYLGAVMNGGDPIASVQPATGRTPIQLQDDVRAYISSRTNFLSQDHEFTAAEVTITRMPPSARDLVWLDLRLARYVPEELRAGNLAEAERAAARYPNDALAARALAQAHMDMQQDEDAVRVLDVAVSAGLDDAPTLRMQAVAMMDLGDTLEETDFDRKTQLYGRARSALARAYQKDASDYRIYLALSRSREDAPGFPTDNDLDTLRFGSDLAPQVQGMSLRTAQALMSRGHYGEAIRYLTPVANNPHGGEGLAPVRALLAEAKSKAGLAPAADDAPPVDDAAADASTGSAQAN